MAVGDGPELREGRDFVSQGELARRWPAAGATGPTRVPDWLLLVWRTLKEMHLWQCIGHLPRGLPYALQPAWKTELWGAYWRGRERGERRARGLLEERAWP